MIVTAEIISCYLPYLYFKEKNTLIASTFSLRELKAFDAFYMLDIDSISLQMVPSQSNSGFRGPSGEIIQVIAETIDNPKFVGKQVLVPERHLYWFRFCRGK